MPRGIYDRKNRKKKIRIPKQLIRKEEKTTLSEKDELNIIFLLTKSRDKKIADFAQSLLVERAFETLAKTYGK